MKFIKVIMPKVMNYYIAPKFREIIKTKFISSSRSYINDNELFVIIDYDSDIYDGFRLYLSKTEKITNGNMYKFQYELNLPEDKISDDDIIFKFTTEENNIKATVVNAYMDKDTIVLIFKII